MLLKMPRGHGTGYIKPGPIFGDKKETSLIMAFTDGLGNTSCKKGLFQPRHLEVLSWWVNLKLLGMSELKMPLP